MIKRSIKLLLILSLISLAALAWLWSDYQSYLETPVALPEAQEIDVRKGMNFSALTEVLEKRSIISEPFYFKLYGRLSGLARQVKAGYYRIEPGSTPIELLALLSAGRSVSYSFTLIEGSTFKQVVAALADNPHLTNDVADLDQAQLIKQLGIKADHLEGQFLAETYHFEKNSSALALLQRANKMLQQTLDEAWQERQDKLPYKSPYEALIMASIVEKETARRDERPQIAGVFVRRLNMGMRLQTDPTVIYGMGERYQGNIRRSDLRRPTPYNTYVIDGLPPTPIAMVGADAIHAALHPADGKALFFVAKGDGSHYFSRTLKEHNAAVRRYQLKRREDYRSSP